MGSGQFFQYVGQDAVGRCGAGEVVDQDGGVLGVRIITIAGNYKVVKGNCDFMGDFEEELLLPLDGGGKLFLTHGHLHGIKQSLLQVYYRAEELGADIVCFGHSHIPGSERLRGKLFINPGSVHLPRVRKERSYAILTLDGSEANVQFFTDEGQAIQDLENTVTLEGIS